MMFDVLVRLVASQRNCEACRPSSDGASIHSTDHTARPARPHLAPQPPSQEPGVHLGAIVADCRDGGRERRCCLQCSTGTI